MDTKEKQLIKSIADCITKPLDCDDKKKKQ